MEREVVLNLLQRFLEKRGVQSVIVKQVLRLIAYGKADGKFVPFFLGGGLAQIWGHPLA